MSRQLKKKSASEKRKKRIALENKNTAPDNSQTKSVANAASKAATKPLSSKLGKKVYSTQTGEPNSFQKAKDFFKEVKLELSKVIWPVKKQVTGTTIVVIIFVLIVSIFLGLFDLGLSTLVQVILT